MALILMLAALDSHAAGSTYRSDSDYLIDAWEAEDGLPENSATAMVQTSDGYLWLGTFNGLVRFDGIRFTVFNRSNTPGLPGDGIVNLCLDRQERLWVSTDAGLTLRQTDSGPATEPRWRTFTAQDGWVGNLVRTFSERANGDLLLTTFEGHVMAFENDRLRELSQPPGEPGHGYFGGVDENGEWWVTQNRFVGRWDGQQLRLGAVPGNTGGFLHRWTTTNAHATRFVCEDRERNLWVGTSGGGLKRFKPRRVFNMSLPSPVPERVGRSVWPASDGGVWMASYEVGLLHHGSVLR